MRTLTLFAGCGGADLGLSRVGFFHVACVEGEKNAAAALKKAGFPAVHAWIGGEGPQGQAPFLAPSDSIGLLWASPPCQPYSSAGKLLGAADKRDGWPATVEVITTTRPKWIIIENVVGAPVEVWAQALIGLGYHPRYETLDAADYGLASHRKRVFLVACKDARRIERFRWPAITHSPRPSLFLKPWASSERVAGVRIAHRVGGDCKGGGGPVKGRTRIEDSPGPCICVTAFASRGPSVGSVPYAVEGDGSERCLTVAEAAALVGFPPGYPFRGSKRAQINQVGNAVAPLMAELLGRAVLDADK